MAMFSKKIPKEYEKSINAVVKFILDNGAEDLSLAQLADIANYSPFHFQKFFKEVMGESPKQFTIRVRLEKAALYLIIHRHRSITDIALDSGFASSATFARAFKKHFGITADELRGLPPQRHSAFRHLLKSKQNSDFFANKYDTELNLKVEVEKNTAFRVIYLNSPLTDIVKIEENFKKIVRFADAHDLLVPETKFIGIIFPHAGLYQTAVTYLPLHPLPKNVNTFEIGDGKFAVCTIKDSVSNIFHAFHTIYENWLPASGYKISGHFAYEILMENPTIKSYQDIARKLHIFLEPE